MFVTKEPVAAIRASVEALRKVARRLVGRRARCYPICASLLKGRVGLEIGGPSPIFSAESLLPLYPIVQRLDNCNFEAAAWQGSAEQSRIYSFDRKRSPGRQFIAEATDLHELQAASYDFLLSSHALEHTANPLRALYEWIRVLKEQGVLVLVVPHKEGTFDHRRPVTSLAHLIEDWKNGTTEEDLTHLPEILALHDLALDPGAGDLQSFKARSERNFENRCLHQHVFDTSLAVELVDHAGLQILAVEPVRPLHIIVIARKTGRGKSPQNDAFLGGRAEYRSSSPFASDRGRTAS